MNSPTESSDNSFKEFLDSEKSGGIILLGCVVIALIMANSPLQDLYFGVLKHRMGIVFDDFVLKKSIEHWINDGLMTVFFFLVGLEIKREVIKGELSSFQKSSLPISAALGGMAIPATIFYLLNDGEETARGWAIPMATDIAFALGILSLLGNRVPNSLRVFLAALAIADDLGAIIVIAIFYTSQVLWTNVFLSGIVFLVLLVLNRAGVRNQWAYLVAGAFLWYFVYKSGVHATVSGVLAAFAIPATGNTGESLLEELEHLLHKPVNYFIMPIFALANTGVILESHSMDGLGSPLSMGILFGLAIGKPVGVLIFSWILVLTRISILPENANWRHIVGAGLLSGIGFTMSIFIALLSFRQPEYQTIAKISILIASVASGLAGFVILRRTKSMEPN
ncbi:Na+/H+ antiporter NhaA [bacterium]|nr:MAG: Na+/H+ antiporter NhaA [bacterium]